MFAQLYTKSSYSLMESSLSIESLVKSAVALNYRAITLSDESVLHGAIKFYETCQKHQITPLIGLIVDLSIKDISFPISLIAKNYQGYQTLIKISTLISTNLKNLTLNELKALDEDLIVIIHSEKGIFESDLLASNTTEINKKLNYFKEQFSDFYIGISNGEAPFWRNLNFELEKLAEEAGITVVALPKVTFKDKSDEETLKVLQAIKHNTKMSDLTLKVNSGNHFYSLTELESYYSKKSLEKTVEILNKCQFQLKKESAILPVYANDLNLSSDQYLRELCIAGLKKRFEGETVPTSYQERLNYELNIIKNMNYSDYFLIVWDFILFARKNQIYVGPGRGSSAGSLVAYSLGITHVDPLKYSLLFERFLNPERVSLPDIDVDFPDNRRQEVIDYVTSRYGENRVAHIITFGSFKARQAIRDVGRVLDFTVSEIDVISKLIPNQPNTSLNKALKASKRLNEIISNDKRYQNLFSLALKLEGLPRHTSIHAAGIVLSNEDLIETVPLLRLDESTVVTQYSMEYLEALGLIKIDFLGLRNLTIIDNVLKLIKTPIDILNIPLDDKKTYQMLTQVMTLGIFQLESDGMRNLLRQLKPAEFNDVVIAIALFRPGPMENIGNYLKARFNPTSIKYSHPILKDILSETAGIIIYQEQIMEIAQKMAGFSLAKADIMRKAMGNKNFLELKSLEKDFIEGAVKQGISQNLAEETYLLILKFANYGFNKAHSVAYGMIAYQMAYLKANYPHEFFTALLNSVKASSSKTKEYLDEAMLSGVKFLPLSVNHSNFDYELEKQQIRLPLTIIKNVGSVSANQIIEARQQLGAFQDFFDFVAKATFYKVNSKVIEALIDAGALAEFNENKATLREAINEALVYSNLITVIKDEKNRLDFSLVSKPSLVPQISSPLYDLEREEAVLGFYLSDHPLVAIKHQLKYIGSNILEIKDKGGEVATLGIISRFKPYQTKTNEAMAFLLLSDEVGEIDVVVLPKQFNKVSSWLKEDELIYVTGEIDKKGALLAKSMRQISYRKGANND